MYHVTCYNDLGSQLVSLAFNNHISNVINKCNKVNGLIRRLLGYRAPASVSINLYKALIQPIIEDSAPVCIGYPLPEFKNEFNEILLDMHLII